MNVRTLVLGGCLLLVLSPLASASVVIPLTLNGVDSGWDAVVTNESYTDVVIDAVGSDYVLIQIGKSFLSPSVDGVFAPHTILFQQRLGDGQAVSSIRIADEIIINRTGETWTDYHWQIVGCSAAFNISQTETSGFSTDPFTDQSWTAAGGTWDSNHADALDVSGGTVPTRSVYQPGMTAGTLFIDVDLSGAAGDFTLKQVPTPEPATMAILTAGGVLMGVRRNRRA
ncbi:MAG TPA: hypothetical protein DCX07_00500 [Phycisphaerales bacterium]|nr:hypothetical protein [Phycisphaerales bacterium]